MKRLIWISLGCMVVFAPVKAASFDCAKAASKIEKLVCGTPVVSMLDDDLRHVYLEVMNKANDEQKQSLMTEQKHWLKYTRNLCTDKSCLKQAYLSRFEELEIFSKKMPAVLAKEVDKAEPTKQVQQVAAQEPTTARVSLEEIQKLLNMAHKQLKEKQKDAHDVLFFSGGMPKDKTGYCEKFWNTLKTQDKFDIPKPDMLAISKREKEKMFESLHAYAKSNFDRYMSQDGKLTPDKYTAVGGQTWLLGPFIKGGLNNPKDLPKKFKDVWQSNADDHGFFDKYHLLDQSLSTHILYMQPYPIAGYVHPLVITFVKDRCVNCTGFSMGIRVVSATGLPQPELLDREYFSQESFASAVTKANKLQTSMPGESYLLMGMGELNGQLLFWTLERQEWVKASAKNIDEDMGYDNGDGFRDYLLDVTPLDDPGYAGPRLVCSVKFN